ncbi:alkaline shock response membrane anchor protein AmaP [Streptomyces capparidis]
MSGTGTGRTAANRVLLALTGLALLAGGGLVLVGGLDLERRWDLALPSWWPLAEPDRPVLSDADRTRWRDEDWWWPAVWSGLGLLVLLCLWWLVSQLRERRVGRVRVRVPGDDDAVVWLRAGALEDALERQALTVEGVDGARATLHRGRPVPRLRLTLTLAAHAVPAAVVARLHREQLAEARDSAGLPALPTEVRLRGDRHPAARVE